MFRSILIRWVVACTAVCATAGFGAAQEFKTLAAAAYVYDQTTGTVLLAHNADTPLPPASMSKLMTLYMAFEALSAGHLHPDELLSVSQHAMDYKGSSMFLRAGERVSVQNLLRGIIVLSGNDASAVIAEALAPDGTEAGFANLMTQRARQLGMTNSRFANSNGWPANGHYMSVHDLAIIAERIIVDFPQYYPMFSEREFPFDRRVPANSRNRNPILGMGIGADGLKTGHTTEAGYGLVGSAQQEQRRIIFVIMGLEHAKDRTQEAQRIIDWAFRQFTVQKVVPADAQLAHAKVWMGVETKVALAAAEDMNALIPVLEPNQINSRIVYETPIVAPIAAGQQVGELIVKVGNLPERRVGLVAAHDVARGGFKARLRTTTEVLWRKLDWPWALTLGNL